MKLSGKFSNPSALPFSNVDNRHFLLSSIPNLNFMCTRIVCVCMCEFYFFSNASRRKNCSTPFNFFNSILKKKERVVLKAASISNLDLHQWMTKMVICAGSGVLSFSLSPTTFFSLPFVSRDFFQIIIFTHSYTSLRADWRHNIEISNYLFTVGLLNWKIKSYTDIMH
jgi:hypothetical protein